MTTAVATDFSTNQILKLSDKDLELHIIELTYNTPNNSLLNNCKLVMESIDSTIRLKKENQVSIQLKACQDERLRRRNLQREVELIELGEFMDILTYSFNPKYNEGVDAVLRYTQSLPATIRDETELLDCNYSDNISRSLSHSGFSRNSSNSINTITDSDNDGNAAKYNIDDEFGEDEDLYMIKTKSQPKLTLEIPTITTTSTTSTNQRPGSVFEDANIVQRPHSVHQDGRVAADEKERGLGRRTTMKHKLNTMTLRKQRGTFVTN
eukprot:Pgem_evm1s7054